MSKKKPIKDMEYFNPLNCKHIEENYKLFKIVPLQLKSYDNSWICGGFTNKSECHAECMSCKHNMIATESNVMKDYMLDFIGASDDIIEKSGDING